MPVLRFGHHRPDRATSTATPAKSDIVNIAASTRDFDTLVAATIDTRNGVKVDNALALNLFGAVKTIQCYPKSLKGAEAASAVLMSTVAVQTGLPCHASIASAKGAVEGLTGSLAVELAPKIRVNAVAPSLTDTRLASSLLNQPARERRRAASSQTRRLAGGHRRDGEFFALRAVTMDDRTDSACRRRALQCPPVVRRPTHTSRCCRVEGVCGARGRATKKGE